MGEVSAAVALNTCKGLYDGKIGSEISYKGKKYVTTEAEDGGTRIVALDPYVFHKGNMKDWKDKL